MQPERTFLRTLTKYLRDLLELHASVHHACLVRATHQNIEITDRFHASAKATCHDHIIYVAQTSQECEETFRDFLSDNPLRPHFASFEPRDLPQDLPLCLLAEARVLVDQPFLGRSLQVGDALNSKVIVQNANSLRSEPGNAQDLPNSR